MDLMITAIVIIVVAISIAFIVKAFTKDSKHDLEIQAGKFRLSIKKHD